MTFVRYNIPLKNYDYQGEYLISFLDRFLSIKSESEQGEEIQFNL